MDLSKITTGGAALHHLATGAITRAEFDDVVRILFDTGEIDWWWFNELHEEASIICDEYQIAECA